MTFEPLLPESCINIAITDSVNVESPESFLVILRRTDNLDERISISKSANELEIEIIDDDSTYDIIWHDYLSVS